METFHFNSPSDLQREREDIEARVGGEFEMDDSGRDSVREIAPSEVRPVEERKRHLRDPFLGKVGAESVDSL